jgi:hypothetical protein
MPIDQAPGVGAVVVIPAAMAIRSNCPGARSTVQSPPGIAMRAAVAGSVKAYVVRGAFSSSGSPFCMFWVRMLERASMPLVVADGSTISKRLRAPTAPSSIGR